MVEVYLPLQESYDTMTEEGFIARPRRLLRAFDHEQAGPMYATCRVVWSILAAVTRMLLLHYADAVCLDNSQVRWA